jgi:tannase/feruloyl esterase
VKIMNFALLRGFVLFALGPAIAAAGSCESLASLSLPNATITSAGAGRASDLPAFCRVALTIKPSSDSDIQVEVWLPSSGWNQKYEAVGNGGWAGSINYAAMSEAMLQGYATSSTDTGHSGAGGNFAFHHPEKVIDYAYRSEHEMVLKAKAIIQAFYGNAPRLSYFNGCSSGGKQGLNEAQRYPGDFDGIIAGAPAVNWTGRSVQSMWIAQAVHKDEASYIPPAKYPVIHKGVLEACDALDGVKDGVLEDPRLCKFDPKAVECKGGDSSSCLSTPQVEAARKIYTPVVNPRTQRLIFPPQERGSEMGWQNLASPQPFGIGNDYFKYVVFEDPNWDYKTLNFDSDVARAEKVDNGTINALNPNLQPYFQHGGKLLQYHGWGDQQISPGSSVLYYNSVLEALGGASKVNGSYRLFMVPGMGHCRGGDGTDTFDAMKALEQWVEQGKAPDKIIASRVRDGAVDRTRPLCPYPQVASYKGSGSTDEAANFVCKMP